jgi:hypothetical protein
MVRTLRHRGRRLAATVLATALALAWGEAFADTECTEAFEKWSKVSAARVRSKPSDTGAQSAGAAQQVACIPSEAQRMDLLAALAKTRSLCDQGTWLDQSAKQTKELIDINASFIGSLTLCAVEPPPAAPIVETKPTPPPKPKPRQCLEVAQVSPERFVLANRKCSGSTVLAVIVKRGPSGKIDCKGYTISRQLQVATLKDARPQVNYECVLAQGNCTKDHVATIFPECDW